MAKSTQFDEGVHVGDDGYQFVAQILNLPLEVNIHTHQIYKIGRITALGTSQKNSRIENMHQLIYASLKQLKEDGYYVYFHIPYHIIGEMGFES